MLSRYPQGVVSGTVFRHDFHFLSTSILSRTRNAVILRINSVTVLGRAFFGAIIYFIDSPTDTPIAFARCLPASASADIAPIYRVWNFVFSPPAGLRCLYFDDAHDSNFPQVLSEVSVTTH